MEKTVVGRLFILVIFMASLLVPFGVARAFGGNVPVIPPSVFTQSASEITSVSAILRADVNPEELNTVAWFEWGSSNEGFTGRVTHGQFIGNGASFIS